MLVSVLWCCMWGRGWEGAVALAPLTAGFRSLPLLSTIKLDPSGADSWVCGLVHALGPCGSLQPPLLWVWDSLLLLPQPPRMCSIRGLRLISLSWSPGLLSLFRSLAVPPGFSMCECGTAGSASCRTACPVPSTIRHLAGSGCIAMSPLHPGCSSPPLIPVWMNVSSLSAWLSDFHAVRFSVSSGCFLFLNCCPVPYS